MAIVSLLAHGHFEADAEGADEVMVLVTIIYIGVHKAHLLRTGIEVEADNKSPAPRSPRGGEGC